MTEHDEPFFPLPESVLRAAGVEAMLEPIQRQVDDLVNDMMAELAGRVFRWEKDSQWFTARIVGAGQGLPGALAGEVVDPGNYVPGYLERSALVVGEVLSNLNPELLTDARLGVLLPLRSYQEDRPGVSKLRGRLMSDLTIPEEALEHRFFCSCGCGREGYQPEALPLIVAAELERLVDRAERSEKAVRSFGVTDYAEGKAEGVHWAVTTLRARASVLRGEETP